MAFRSELDSARERADAAEAESKRLSLELDGQRARMERVEEIEGQLVEARAKLRVGGHAGSSWVALWILLGVLVGGGAAYWHGRMALTEARTEMDAVRSGLRGDLAAAQHASEAARAEVVALEHAAEDQATSSGRSREELRELLVALTGAPAPYDGRARWMDFGRVLRVRGDLATRTGDRCVIVVSATGACSGELRCGRALVHELGCPTRPATTLRGDGSVLTITHAFETHTVVLDAALPSDGPLPAMPVSPTPYGVGPESLPPGVFPPDIDPRALSPERRVPSAVPRDVLGDPF